MPRNRKPINLRVLDSGARHGETLKKPATKSDAAAALAKPSPWLDRSAKRFWRRILPELDSLGVLHPIDRWSLELLCAAYSDWQTARKEAAGKFSVASAAGSLKRSPAAAAAAAAHAQFYKQMESFGMTPAARSKLGLTGEQPAHDDEFDKLLN